MSKTEITKIKNRIEEINKLTRSLTVEKRKLAYRLKELEREIDEKQKDEIRIKIRDLFLEFDDAKKVEQEMCEYLEKEYPAIVKAKNDLFSNKTDEKTGIVFQHDKRSGLTYAYENDCWWDEEKQQSRQRRTIIGRVDTDEYLGGAFKCLSREEILKRVISTGIRVEKQDNSQNT